MTGQPSAAAGEERAVNDPSDIRLRARRAPAGAESTGEYSLEGYRDERAALHRLTERLFLAHTAQLVYDAALDAIGEALGCGRAAVLIFDGAGVMRFVDWRGLSENYRRTVEGHSPWKRGVKDPQPILVPDVEAAEFPAPIRAALQADKIGALAFFPLVSAGELIGKFMTYYPEPHEFDRVEQTIALTIARQLGFSIAQLRAAELQRRVGETGRLLASIVESSADAIVSKDLEGIVTSWNHGAQRIFGYTAEEMIGKSITLLIPSDRQDEERTILDKIRRGERLESYETIRRRKDGSLLDISLTVSPLRDANGRIVGASKIARDITERKQAMARLELLTRELHHRTKNLFAIVHAIISRSFAGKTSVQEARDAALNRLHSLALTNAMLVDRDWRGADIREVVQSQLRPFGGRVAIEGPPLELSAKAAQSFALAVHELATNAAKYGALSNASGRISVEWSTDGTEEEKPAYRFSWSEAGGPPVSSPGRAGFGSAVLEQAMSEYVERPPLIDYATEGFHYELVGTLKSITPKPKASAEAAADRPSF